ncbi:hypothetical protein LZK73_18360 [Neorhizobium galegae]|nr:hypothetical protein LZK73_18360 [Neorhizobium galegae]
MSKIIVPSSNQPISGGGGIITTVWMRFFNALLAPPSAVQSVPATASPVIFKGSERGVLIISGGTVTSTILRRATTNVDLTGASIVPVSIGDEVSIAFSGSPTILFIPQ